MASTLKIEETYDDDTRHQQNGPKTRQRPDPRLVFGSYTTGSSHLFQVTGSAIAPNLPANRVRSPLFYATCSRLLRPVANFHSSQAPQPSQIPRRTSGRPDFAGEPQGGHKAAWIPFVRCALRSLPHRPMGRNPAQFDAFCPEISFFLGDSWLLSEDLPKMGRCNPWQAAGVLCLAFAANNLSHSFATLLY